MERFKENLQVNRDQNLASFVIMVCFLMVAFSFSSALSLDSKTVDQGPEETTKVAVSQTK